MTSRWRPRPTRRCRRRDDTLLLLFMCCHPALTRPSAIALTLRAVGGLTTAEIASAFLVPEATMAQRISRAKQSIKASGVPFAMPTEAERAERLGAVLHVLYLIFNEGYAARAGRACSATDLSSEAIRLARAVHRLLPDDGEVAGLLALMLLTDARRAGAHRTRGRAHPARRAGSRALGPRRHRRGRRARQRGARARRGRLVSAPGRDRRGARRGGARRGHRLAADPRALRPAPAHVRQPDGALEPRHRRRDGARARARASSSSRPLDGDARIAGHHRLDAVRAHLLERAGRREAAIAHYRRAAGRTASLPERDYLNARAARLAAR